MDLFKIFSSLVISALVVGLLSTRVNTSPGTGEKIGQVVKMSRQGLFNKTWEGQLIRGGMTDGSGTFGMVPFDFTVEDEAQVRELQEHMRNQTEILITYEIEGLYTAFRTESGGHFLKSVSPAPTKNPDTSDH